MRKISFNDIMTKEAEGILETSRKELNLETE
jgi:hypothetical protein